MMSTNDRQKHFIINDRFTSCRYTCKAILVLSTRPFTVLNFVSPRRLRKASPWVFFLISEDLRRGTSSISETTFSSFPRLVFVTAYTKKSASLLRNICPVKFEKKESESLPQSEFSGGR